MEPVTFVGQHNVLGAPKGWEYTYKKYMGECLGLPIAQHHGCIYSVWKFTLRERVQILFGKKMQLIVVGETMPPVSMNMSEFNPIKLGRDEIPMPTEPPSHRPEEITPPDKQ